MSLEGTPQCPNARGPVVYDHRSPLAKVDGSRKQWCLRGNPSGCAAHQAPRHGRSIERDSGQRWGARKPACNHPGYLRGRNVRPDRISVWMSWRDASGCAASVPDEWSRSDLGVDVMAGYVQPRADPPMAVVPIGSRCGCHGGQSAHFRAGHPHVVPIGSRCGCHGGVVSSDRSRSSCGVPIGSRCGCHGGASYSCLRRVATAVPIGSRCGCHGGKQGFGRTTVVMGMEVEVEQ